MSFRAYSTPEYKRERNTAPEQDLDNLPINYKINEIAEKLSLMETKLQDVEDKYNMVITIIILLSFIVYVRFVSNK